MVGSNHCDEETPLFFSSRFDDNDGTKAPRTQSISQGQPNYVRNLRSRLRDAEYRSKVIRSIAIYMCNFTSGMTTAQLGPALLDLQIITQTTVQEASTFLSAASAGSMVGSLTTGFIYDHLSKDLLLILSELFMGLMLLVIPFSSPYWLMVTACFLLNVFRISTGLTVNVEIFRMWGKQAKTMSHAIQLSFSIGAVISPLITEPFLVSRNNTSAIDLSNRSRNDSLDLQLDYDSIFVTDAIPGASLPEMPKTRVHFAFMITSIACFFVTAVLVADYASGCFRKAKRTNGKLKQSKGGQRDTLSYADGGKCDHQNSRRPQNSSPSALDLSLVPYIGVVVWISLFYSMHYGNRSTASSYLETYAVLEMSWSKSRGAFLSSVYWVSIAVTRLISMFVASFISPVQILIISFTAFVPSHLLFVFMSLYHVDVGVWISTVLCAAALSPVYSAFLAWMDNSLITLTGKVISCIGLGSHAGSLLSISILGYLIENYGAIWFTYVLLGEAILNSILFFSLLLFARLYLQPKHSTRRNVVVTYSTTGNGSEPTALLK